MVSKKLPKQTPPTTPAKKSTSKVIVSTPTHKPDKFAPIKEKLPDLLALSNNVENWKGQVYNLASDLIKSLKIVDEDTIPRIFRLALTLSNSRKSWLVPTDLKSRVIQKLMEIFSLKLDERGLVPKSTKYDLIKLYTALWKSKIVITQDCECADFSKFVEEKTGVSLKKTKKRGRKADEASILDELETEEEETDKENVHNDRDVDMEFSDDEYDGEYDLQTPKPSRMKTKNQDTPEPRNKDERLMHLAENTPTFSVCNHIRICPCNSDLIEQFVLSCANDVDGLRFLIKWESIVKRAGGIDSVQARIAEIEEAARKKPQTQ